MLHRDADIAASLRTVVLDQRAPGQKGSGQPRTGPTKDHYAVQPRLRCRSPCS